MTVPARLSAALADRYRIERELGQGGMATVYLAEDLKHRRKVAVKVLKPELAAVLGAERFVQEITTTAALQHPHILPLFDSGEADGFLYYVMPFIDGETLRSRLDREKQLGIEDAVRIAREVADALDHAHRHGVVHRDIKPENILLHDGRPMVADFGIALALSAAAGGRMTETGLSLGTPHYMSPEQATAEKDITARADIYSLGSVLYEMLTGNPPHVGATAQQIIMKIVTEEARPVTQWRRSVPRNVAAAVHKAIEKLPGDRFASASAFAQALADAGYVDPAARPPTVPLRRNRPAMLMAGVAALAVIASVWSHIDRPRAGSRRPLARLVLALADSQDLTVSAGRRVTFTRDGRAFVYVGDGAGGTRLFLRPLDATEATPIPGSEGATNPAFSPDGETIAFISFGPFTIKVIPRTGGIARTIASGTNTVSGGGLDWGPDGYIYFDAGTGIGRVRADGSASEIVAPLSPTEAAAWPIVLPNGRTILARVRRTGETEEQYTIEAVDLATRTRKVLLRGLVARYLPEGYLLYVSARGELFAQRFDQDRVELRGEPVLLWSGLSVATFGASDIAVSPSGALLYTAGGNDAAARRQVVWVSRGGVVSPIDSPAVAGLVTAVALSHDGSRLALDIAGGTTVEAADIWVKQLGGGPLSQVTRGGHNWSPTWSPDDGSLLFMSDRDSAIALYRQRADGSSAAVREVGGLDVNAEYGLASDGRTLVFRLNRGAGNGDLYAFRAGADTAFTPLIPSPALERTPSLSPDGRWLAYGSDEGGRSQVYVRPFPAVDSARIQVSTDGGVRPRWNHAGTELFYRSPSNDFMAARVLPGPAMRFERPVRLFSVGGFFQFTSKSWYDVAPDDQRFVMIESGVGGVRRSDRLAFVDDILPELAKRIPR